MGVPGVSDRGRGYGENGHEERHRSLSKCRCSGPMQLDATFDLDGSAGGGSAGAELDWDQRKWWSGVSDARGALADAVLTAKEKR